VRVAQPHATVLWGRNLRGAVWVGSWKENKRGREPTTKGARGGAPDLHKKTRTNETMASQTRPTTQSTNRWQMRNTAEKYEEKLDGIWRGNTRASCLVGDEEEASGNRGTTTTQGGEDQRWGPPGIKRAGRVGSRGLPKRGEGKSLGSGEH